MNALRTKSTVYKEKRAELSELRAESGVLARTCEVSPEPFENALSSVANNRDIVANNRVIVANNTGSSVFLADSCSTQVLRSRETNIQQSLAALEKERGVSGFRDTTENLERVAEQKVMSKNNLFFYKVGKLFLRLGQVGQSMTIR